MGSFDGAETCELVGLYILFQIREAKIGVDANLYRDDGLAASDKTERQIDNIKKQLVKLFQKFGLQITITVNTKVVDFLDITLNLNSGLHQPFNKPGNKIDYVDNRSNHPPNIKKNIPKNLNDRLSKLSSNETVFKNTVQPYQEALDKSGYNHKLSYEKPKEKTKKRKRNRNVTWFNPPYSDTVKTNIGQKFFELIEKCFPEGHKLRKCINKKTVKLSYSCMPNIKSTISSHNKKVYNDFKKARDNKTDDLCNCRTKSNCPLDNKCKSSVVYQATVTNSVDTKIETYGGLAKDFKIRHRGHTNSFREDVSEDVKKQTALSTYVHKLKAKNIEPEIKFKILKYAQAYSSENKKNVIYVSLKNISSYVNQSFVLLINVMN